MFTLKTFPENKRCVVIEDRIGLPSLTRMLKWSQNMIGPVLHPTHFDLEVIEALLMDGCKKIYVLHPENYADRVLISKENFKVPYAQLFNVEEDAVEDGVVDLTDGLVDPATGEVIIDEVGLVPSAVETVELTDGVTITDTLEVQTTVEASDDVRVLTEVPTPVEVLENATETVEEPTVETLEEPTTETIEVLDPTTETVEESTVETLEEPNQADIQEPEVQKQQHQKPKMQNRSNR